MSVLVMFDAWRFGSPQVIRQQMQHAAKSRSILSMHMSVLVMLDAWRFGSPQFIRQKKTTTGSIMDKFLRPKRFDCNPSSNGASKEWVHWYRYFCNFLGAVEKNNPNMNKLDVLINYVSPNVYEYLHSWYTQLQFCLNLMIPVFISLLYGCEILAGYCSYI